MLTDEQCNEFRRLPMSFNDMVRAIYEAGRASKAAEYAYIHREATNAALKMAAERFDRMTIECGTNATIRCEYASQIIRNLKD